jgi:EmrB/QacA subfamily drug resistance transporter
MLPDGGNSMADIRLHDIEQGIWAQSKPRGGDRDVRMLTLASAANFLTILDLWVVSIAYPAFERVFLPATLSDVSWILNAYALVLAALLIPSGRIADGVGRKRWFLVGLVTFGVASLGCGAASTLPVLIAFRALQGVGAAVLMPTSLGFALSAFPEKDRGAAVGIWAAVGAAAAGSGPLVGGMLLTLSWRWLFLINVPLIVVAVVEGIRHLPATSARVRREVDWLGTLLVFAATALVCTALVEIGTWTRASEWATLWLGGCVWAAFVFHVLAHRDPIVTPRLFVSRRFRFGAMGIFVYYVGFASMLVGSTLLFTDCFRFSAFRAALAIAPGPCTATVLSLVSGRLSARFGFRRVVVSGALFFAAAGIWPLCGAAASSSYAYAVLPGLICWGVANALLQPALFATADAAPSSELSSASAVLTMARQLGSAVGVALLVAALQNRHAPGLDLLRRAWIIVIASAAVLVVLGLRAAPGGLLRRQV